MRNKKIIMVALIMAVISLTVGFAAFSSSLNISSVATVTPTSSYFGVKFSSSSTELKDGSVNASNSIGSTATIVNSAIPTITNLDASFTEPGQSVSYTFYVMNVGEYDAYLNRIVFNTTPVTCTGGTGATQSLVDAACSSIHVRIKVGSENAVENTTTLTNHILTKSQKTEQVVVTLSYDSTGKRVDGPMNVSFSDISLIYSTVAGASDTGNTPRIVYRNSTETISIGSTIDPSDTTKFTTNSSTLGKDYYLKHVTDTNNKVIESYACARFNNKETCLRGGSADYYGYADDASNYTGNALILKNIETEGLSCSFTAVYSACSAGSVALGAEPDGSVYTVYGSIRCNIKRTGSSFCDSV